MIMSRWHSIFSLCTRLIITAAGLAIASCGGGQKPQVPQMPGVAFRASVIPPPPSRGLEMYWWGFDDGGDGATLARHLREYVANSVPISAAMQQAWRLNGLRMVSVPQQDVAVIEEALKANGTQRKLLGEVTAWATLAAGPAWTGQQRLQMAEGELGLEGGRLRLIARAWTVPDIVEGRDGELGMLRYVTRVEIAVQHEERDGRTRELTREPTDTRGIHEAGLVLSRTIASFDLWPNEAVLIFPEPPDADLIVLASSRPEPETESVEAGPEVPRMPTAGELLLAGRALGKGAARRAVIVLMNAQPPPGQ